MDEANSIFAHLSRPSDFISRTNDVKDNFICYS